MSSFCTAKATHIFFSKKFQHICISLNVNFNESLANGVVSFEQLSPGVRSAMLAASHLPGRGPTDVDVAPVPAH